MAAADPAEAADAFPLDTYKDAARHMRRPFTPAAVKFKVQAVWPKDNPASGLIVSYIDARLAVERLNLLVPHLWHDAYRPVGSGQMWCDLTVDGITRSDVGEGQAKGLVSDALKRAAVKFGIGVSLYAIPKMILSAGDNSLKQKKSREGLTLELTPKGEHILRGMYEHWLDQHGRQAFGEPLDHGDMADAQGDAEAEDTPAEPAVPAPEPQAEVLSGVQVIDPERAVLIGEAMRDRAMTVRQIAGVLAMAGVGEVALTKPGVEAAILALTPQQAVEVEQQLSKVNPIPKAA